MKPWINDGLPVPGKGKEQEQENERRKEVKRHREQEVTEVNRSRQTGCHYREHGMGSGGD